MTQSVLARLGFGPEDRVVIVHQDDVGMGHGANQAFVQLSQHGLISCGSVMVPCPWFLEAAALAREHPQLDLGVHLTLTAEWRYYRWGPISTRDRSSGLIDEEGYFWHRSPQVREHINLAAAEAEFRAQIETALAAGIDVTHVDTHMGVATMPELLSLYVALGNEYRLPVLILPRLDYYFQTLGLQAFGNPDQTALAAGLAATGMPVVDHFLISPFTRGMSGEAAYRTLLADAQPGLNFISLHPNAAGDIEAITPEKGHFRIAECQILQDPGFLEYAACLGIHIIGYRCLRELLRQPIAAPEER